MTRNQWIEEYKKRFNLKEGLNEAPTWIIELAVRYGRLDSTAGLRTETEHKMYDACLRLDVAKVKRMSEIWKFMVVQEAEDARQARRKIPEVPAEAVARNKRPTAAATVLVLLREKPVRSDAAIIEAVHTATFHDGFNVSQLAWYKAKFKRGELKGQNGKPETIQGDDDLVSKTHKTGTVTTTFKAPSAVSVTATSQRK